jgi:hypothetical protein
MATVGAYGVGGINATEGSGASLVILIALIILFGAAAYFTGRLYGTAGTTGIVARIVVILLGLMALGGLWFG